MIDIIGEVDRIARSIESKYGTEYKDRIPDELYEKFERQKALFDNAIISKKKREIEIQALAMVRGWKAVEKALADQGTVWKVKHSCGVEITFFKDKLPDDHKDDPVTMNINEVVKFIPAKIIQIADVVKPSVIGDDWNTSIDDEIPF